MLPLSSPTKLGRYEVVDEIGKGAMGVVYLARDPLIGRLVALKTFRIGLSVKDAELDQFRARFIREAQSAGILSHPNIVTIHDVVEHSDDGVAFIAMEYVRGTNLKLVLQQPQRPTLPYAAEILGQIASGLDYAHSCKVIHRDIKPANILITSDNRAKITDFGIARLDTSNLTQEGQLLGTPNYMSPEQILGRDVDARADIFSLGVVLYEMITRHKPFQGENLTMVSHRIVYDQFTPPSEYVDDLPPGTEQILGKALEKDPARRYQRAQDMAEDLRKVIGSVSTRDHLNETQSLSSTAFIAVPAPAPRAAGGPGGRRPGAATDPIPVIPPPPAAPTGLASAAPSMPPPPLAAAAATPGVALHMAPTAPLRIPPPAPGQLEGGSPFPAAYSPMPPPPPAPPPAVPASSPAPAPGQAGTGSFWRRLTERGRGAGGRGAAVAAAGSQPAPAAPPAAASGPGAAQGVEPATTRLDATALAAAGAAALVAGAAGATTPAAGAAGRTAAAVPAPSPPAAAADRLTAQPDRPSQPTQPTQVNAAATVSPGQRAGSSEMPTAPLPIRPAGGQVSGPAVPPPAAGAAASASPAGDGYRHGTRPIAEPVPPVGGRFDAGSPSAGAAQQMPAGGAPGAAPGGLAPVTPPAAPTLTAPLGSPVSATPPPPPPPVRAPSSYPPSTAAGGVPPDSPAPQAAATAPVAPTAQMAPMAPIAPVAARPKRGFFSLPSALGFILALAIGLVLAGALVAAQVVWTQTQRVPAQQARKLAAEQETRQRVMSLLADGHHRLEIGDSDGAVAAFRAAEQLVAGHRGPVSLRTAAEHLQSDQRLRVDQERQIETRLIEGRQFLADRRYDEAEAAAQAALTISPGNTVALDILNGVKAGRTRTRDRAAAQAALAARAAIPAPPPVAPAAPPRAEPAPATAPAEAKDASLDISFFSQLPEGSLLIYVNGSKLLQESFRFHEKGGLFRSKPTSGTLRRSFKLKAGNADIRLYVTPQGSAAVVKILSGNFPGGGARRLDIRLDGDGNVSYQLN